MAFFSFSHQFLAAQKRMEQKSNQPTAWAEGTPHLGKGGFEHGQFVEHHPQRPWKKKGPTGIVLQTFLSEDVCDLYVDFEYF